MAVLTAHSQITCPSLTNRIPVALQPAVKHTTVRARAFNATTLLMPHTLADLP